jgi:hypothetical protein
MSISWNTGRAAERARHNIKMRAKKLKHTNLKEKYASLEPSNEGWHNLKLKNKKRKKRQASSSKRQDYINGERLQHALGWKGSSDFGPKPQASSRKRALKKT